MGEEHNCLSVTDKSFRAVMQIPFNLGGWQSTPLDRQPERYL